MNGRTGFASTLVAAKVTPKRLNQTVKIINHYENVTHNYLRSHSYNLWFTLKGTSRSEVLKTLNEIKRKCSLRQVMELPAQRVFKLKVLNYHRRTPVNCLAVWQVPKNKIYQIGKIMAESPEVSHCYQRATKPNWPYNLYTMIHSRSKTDCKMIIQNIVRQTGITKYDLLYTLKKYKKKARQK